MNAITSFKGEYHFLSNFYPCQITVSGRVFSTLEHAYVSEKTLIESEKDFVLTIPTPGKAKRYGRNEITLRPNWDGIKLEIMRSLVTQKFENPELMQMLLNTAGMELIEGNMHGDTFFGQCPLGVGKNHLGVILMGIRDKYIMFN